MSTALHLAISIPTWKCFSAGREVETGETGPLDDSWAQFIKIDFSLGQQPTNRIDVDMSSPVHVSSTCVGDMEITPSWRYVSLPVYPKSIDQNKRREEQNVRTRFGVDWLTAHTPRHVLKKQPCAQKHLGKSSVEVQELRAVTACAELHLCQMKAKDKATVAEVDIGCEQHGSMQSVTRGRSVCLIALPEQLAGPYPSTETK
ncbi:hypothetical protein Q8A73_021897 [Channa argus]|nr:hypothetical protein Q8A73_021897 [Channa argus]